RALESQLERSLAWRCSQTLVPKGVRGRGQKSAAPGGSAEGVDYGAARLCRGLLEQCDLCADAVRGLCAAVRTTNFSQDEALTADASSSSSRPHRAALDRVVKTLPGLALQSDHLSAAVDNARVVLQLPRNGEAAWDGGMGDGEGGDKEGTSPGRQRHGRQQAAPTRVGRASRRLMSLFAAGDRGGGGGGRRRRMSGTGGGVISPAGMVASRGRSGEKSRILSLGAELRRSLADVDPSERIFGDRWVVR
ncbi:unnamed protein product, partial [Hapterophycus canaliculatus]